MPNAAGGDLGDYQVGALPNATYIAFTGTPIDRISRGQEIKAPSRIEKIAEYVAMHFKENVEPMGYKQPETRPRVGTKRPVRSK